MAAADDLTQLLACPACFGALRSSSAELRCAGCEAAYTVDDGIPVLLRDGLREWHKDQQACFFDSEDAAFELSRPHGTPGLHGWLLEEKFRRSIDALPPLFGLTALTVCGGSGMDAEFLARAGARVIASDISLGAVRRARERARRHGLAIVPVVADAERLPFRDRSVELVYVHDGLHHLERPRDGLGEMARVAGRAVSVTEPARAAATALAVSVGLALEREEAGNRVARLSVDEVSGELRLRGFDVVRAGRYAMYYRHEPGAVTHVLSRRRLLPLAQVGLRTANRLAGRFGNKLTVQAIRRAGA